MKKSLLFALTIILFSLSSFAQNDIQLNIHHKLNNGEFAFDAAAQNNLDHYFNITRLQYYISEISITHDGGSIIKIEDLWLLVDAGINTQFDLGNHDIDKVEKINFFIGVGADYNHLDPASYEASHPLAPKFPSMHWGWVGGYRFVALEGYGGSAFSQRLELHGLEDPNYFQTEIELNITAKNNELVINIDADYARALENIELNSGMIVHGGYSEAKQCLENFRDFVFSSTSLTTSTVDFSEVSKFDVFPNPANGNTSILLEANQDFDYEVIVTDVLGKPIMLFSKIKSNSTIDLDIDHAGFYYISLIKEGQPIITKKLISK